MKDAVLILGLGSSTLGLIRTIHQFYPRHEVFVASYNRPKHTPFMFSWIKLVEGAEVEITKQFFHNIKYDLACVINRLDSYILIHGKLVSAFGLPGPGTKALSYFRYKSETYRFMLDHGLSNFHPRSRVIRLGSVDVSINEFNFPYVIKPSVGAKSRAVYIVNSKTDLSHAVKNISNHYSKPKIVRIIENNDILIEDYIDGKQIAPVSYVDSDGELHIIAGVDVVRGPDIGQKHIQNVYRSTPSQMTETQLAKVKWLLQKIVSLSGLKSTFLDPELYWVGDRLYLIEINCRLGGFRNTLFKEAYGIDLDKAVVDLALGEKPDLSFVTNKSCTACEIWDDRSGQIKSFELPEGYEYIELSQKFKNGDYYTAPPQSDKPLASFYLSSSSRSSLNLAYEMRSQVKLEIN